MPDSPRINIDRPPVQFTRLPAGDELHSASGNRQPKSIEMANDEIHHAGKALARAFVSTGDSARSGTAAGLYALGTASSAAGRRMAAKAEATSVDAKPRLKQFYTTLGRGFSGIRAFTDKSAPVVAPPTRPPTRP